MVGLREVQVFWLAIHYLQKNMDTLTISLVRCGQNAAEARWREILVSIWQTNQHGIL